MASLANGTAGPAGFRRERPNDSKVGKLILAANVPEEYHQVLTRVSEARVNDWQGEHITFGLAHAEVGAYLIGLWGLSDALVEAIAFHHRPARSAGRQFGPLAAVHLADALEHHRRIEGGRHAARDLDLEYLAQVGLGAAAADPAGLLAQIDEGKE